MPALGHTSGASRSAQQSADRQALLLEAPGDGCGHDAERQLCESLRSAEQEQQAEAKRSLAERERLQRCASTCFRRRSLHKPATISLPIRRSGRGCWPVRTVGGRLCAVSLCDVATHTDRHS